VAGDVLNGIPYESERPFDHQSRGKEELTAVNIGGSLSQRLYVRNWGVTETLRNIPNAYECVSIGTGSHHDSVLINPSGSDRFFRLSSRAPLIYSFQPPIKILPAVSIDSPLELIFYAKVPQFLLDARSIQRRQWFGGALFGSLDESPLGFARIFIGGRRRWRMVIFNGSATTLNLQVAYLCSSIWDQNGTAFGSTSFDPNIIRVPAMGGGNPNIIIDSERDGYSSNAAVVGLYNPVAGTFWDVAGATSFLMMETED
jgi:hypothetical protein